MNNRTQKFKNAVNESAFVNILNRISDFFHNKICYSKTAQALTSFDKISAKSDNSLFSRLIDRIKPKKKSVISLKKEFSRIIEHSFFYNLVHKLIALFLGAKLRVYGVLLFIIGVFSTGIGLIERFLITPSDNDLSLLFQGIVFILISIPLFSSKKELCTALVQGRISGALLDFTGIKKEDIIKKPVDENLAFSVLAGVFLGILSSIIPPVIYIIAILAAVYLLFVFHKPEFSTIVFIATLPFIPTMAICAEIIITLISYLLKVARGKRSLRLDILDIFVMIFALFMFFGGIFSVSPSTSLPPACVFICFIASYFLIVNLIKTKDLLKKTVSFSLLSFFVCSIYGVYQNYFGAPDTTWTDEDMFSEIETRVVSTFENPNVFGEYLIMLIPVALAFFILAKNFASRTINFAALLAAASALIFTWSRGAWIGCLLSMVIFFVIINRRVLGAYVLGILAVPAVIPFLPDSIISRFSSIGNMTDSSTSYRVFIWEASANMIKDYFASGIGIGTGAFQNVYSEYALAAIETAPHSHNLYLQLIIELGIFGFAVFLITIFLFYSKIFTFLKKSERKEGRLIAGAVSCGLLAILAQGLTDYVWYNYRVFGFFWMMLAVAVATVNLYNREEQIDEMIM